MNASNILTAGVILELVCIIGLLYTNGHKQDNISKFNITADTMVKDMDGRVIQLPYGQAWPFDPTQSLSVSVVAKKQVDEFVVVLVDVKALADVKQDTKGSKEKVTPAKVRLGGYAKLTYEVIGEHWNLVSLDSVSLKATAIDTK